MLNLFKKKIPFHNRCDLFKLITPSVDFSTLKMNLKNKTKQRLSKSEVAPSPTLSKELQVAMKKQNAAALVLTRKVIASEAKNSNFIFSPASINTALTMMAASTGSVSEELKAVYREIATVVFADGRATGGPKISAVNGYWVEQSLPFDGSLKALMENVFKATFNQVDFISKAEKVREELNKWASDHTKCLIKDIFPPGSITSDTQKVCGNALYFKGFWENKFDKSLTKDKEFHLLGNGSKRVRVPFMISHKSQYIEAYNGFKVLRLPYRQGHKDTSRSFSMYFYLPDKKDGLNNLVEEMISTPGFLDNHTPEYKVKVGDFRIPKFKMSFMFEVSRVLDELLDTTMYHKACVEIDEDGTEAAAATFWRYMSYTPPPIDFVAHHPFLFLIREDKTGTVLFAGQILDPSKSS